ncbi:hypothetical protein FISHEDRAFT_67354 [Fistulina hepatica ATCC 64428]|uniref:Sas10 C-terminal domain-containing protein n=1 Tax=Fistulina hepatica ATCC 64428 TaxID=1128425 RepID=A0A0D7A208_9AGAR|nr:hypothetical protein FISHEDRAFT_67354 [Fistulina hepatica ATCC 64428]
MPRRPGKGNKSTKAKARPVDRADSKIKRWKTAADVPLDEEDEFHAAKDQILLESDEEDDDAFGDEDEVFGLKGLREDDDDIEDDGEEDAYMDVDDIDEADELPAKPKKSKHEKSEKKKKKQAETSEESESESEEETWGSGKNAYYATNAAALDSDDEERNALEEQEAKRLQGKNREGMTEDDFGLGDAEEVKDGADDPWTDESAVPTVRATPRDPAAAIRLLEKTNPEALALARDWDDTAHYLIDTQERIKRIEASSPDALSLGMAHIHYQTLLTYATTLAFYLHLRASEKYARRPETLQNHPILQRLLTLKQAISTLEDLDFAASDDEELDEDELDDPDEDLMLDGSDEDIELTDAQALWLADKENGLEAGELQDLVKDSRAPVSPTLVVSSQAKDDAGNGEPRPAKKRKISKKSIAPVFDLVEPTFSGPSSSSSKTSASAPAPVDDAFGEATALQAVDATDKRARTKSLRFYTSRIESASARRQGARNAAMGGDDDIPYRERRKEKEARLANEAAKKPLGQGGEDLDPDGPEPPMDVKEADVEGPDGYYELVRRASSEKKAKKKAEYDAARAAAKAEIEAAGAGAVTEGPRSLTRAILANKGITPRRPKSVRNPRVKKRQKFEQAKKKVASQKAVFKGGLAQTGGKYYGEQSGISKVAKGVRF